MDAININQRVEIYAGIQGEHNARVISIDVSEFASKWPDAGIPLMIRRAADDRVYPAAVVREGDVLHWTITAAETQDAAGGEMQVVACDAGGDVIAKSRPGKWYVRRSINGIVGDAPEPEKAWVAQVLQAGNAAGDAADRADAALQEMRRAVAAGEFKGADGRDGRDGADGSDGRDGTDGRDGRDGLDAPQIDDDAISPNNPWSGAKVAKGLDSKADRIGRFASGMLVHIDDASDYGIVELAVYGKSRQNGVPSPDAPVEIVSVGDGGNIEITVCGENTIPSRRQLAAIPNMEPLRAVPVSSGGNLTIDGQQYIADVLRVSADGSGEIERNTGEYTIDGTEGWEIAGKRLEDGSDYYYQSGIIISDAIDANSCGTICTDYPNNAIYNNTTNQGSGIVWGKIRIRWGDEIPINDFAANMSARFSAGNPVKIIYQLAEPTTEPIAPEFVSALLGLHTYCPITNIHNSDGATIKVKYVADGMTVIDKLTQRIAALEDAAVKN